MVEVRYRTGGGGRLREIMRQDSTAIPGQDEFQRYSHTFKNVLEPISFEVTGGDERIGKLFIEPVDSPKFVELVARCEYPAYLVDRATGAFTPRDVTIGGPLEVPEGTHVKLHCTASSPVASVLVKSADQDSPRPIALPPSRESQERFEYDCGAVNGNRVLFFTLVDPDGLANREPIAVELVARPDVPPSAGVRLAGIGSAITPDALLPIRGELTDDYALAKAWFAVQIGEQPGGEFPLAREVGRQRRARFDADALPSSGSSKPAPTAARPRRRKRRFDLKDLREDGKLAQAGGQVGFFRQSGGRLRPQGGEKCRRKRPLSSGGRRGRRASRPVGSPRIRPPAEIRDGHRGIAADARLVGRCQQGEDESTRGVRRRNDGRGDRGSGDAKLRAERV